MADIIKLSTGHVGDGVTLDPDSVLGEARGKLRSVAIVGIADDGALYTASSVGFPETLVLLNRAARRVLRSYD